MSSVTTPLKPLEKFAFPSESEIKKYLINNSEAGGLDYEIEKGLVDAIAKSFADKQSPEPGIRIGVTLKVYGAYQGKNFPPIMAQLTTSSFVKLLIKCATAYKATKGDVKVAQQEKKEIAKAEKKE